MVKNRRRASALTTAVSVVALQVGVALAAPTVIPNGTFETDPPGSSTTATDTDLITGWTVLNQLVDLGTTSIAGCPTVDTQDYTQLREWYIEALDEEGDPLITSTPYVTPTDPSPFDGDVFVVEYPAGTPLVFSDGAPLVFDDYENEFAVERNGTVLRQGQWDTATLTEFNGLVAAAIPYTPMGRADDVSTVDFFDSDIEFSTHLVAMNATTTESGPQLEVPGLGGGSTFDVDSSFLERTGTALLLYSDMSNDAGYDGYVAHGPAVYSDVFTVETAPRSITLDWAALGDSDDFAVLGYLLNVDTCAQTEIVDAAGESAAWTSTSVTVDSPGDYRFVFVSGTFDKSFGGAAGALFFIDTIAQTAVFSEPGIELELSAEVGATVAGSPVQISGGGLKAASAFSLTLLPSDEELASGTTSGAGGFLDLVALPDGLAAGAYTLRLTAVAPDDSALTTEVGFTVASDGTFGAISDAPAPATDAPAPVSSPVPDPGGDLPTATPPGSTSGSVDGVPTAPTPSVPTTGTASYQVGVVQAEVRTGGAGTVSGPSSAPVLQVVRDRVATVGGGGMAPGGIVEVWMPLPGGGSRQVALLPVAPDGTFDGALPFTGELDGNGPLPIGERTIQLFGTDANGQLTVINVGIRVTQPGPFAPEPERTPGAPPSLAPGQSLATNAGIPTPVTVTPQPGSRRVGVAGDGWLLEIDVPEGTVRDEAGNPIMEIVTGDDTEVRGTGFMPDTRAYVWIMSTPTFLGEVTVRSDGSFAGDLPVDVAPGQHTLQVAGVGTDGYVRAANLGVIVLAGDGTPRPNRIAAGEGTAPLLPLETGALALALAAGLAVADRTRRRGRSTAR